MSVTPDTVLLHLRCAHCRYGASCRTMPERCPMCGSSIWDLVEPRDAAAFLSDLDEPLSRDQGANDR